LYWAAHLFRRAAEAGNSNAPGWLAAMRQTRQGIGKEADVADVDFLACEAGSKDTFPAAVFYVDDVLSFRELYELVLMRQRAGDRAGLEEMVRRAVDHGNGSSLIDSAVMWEKAGYQIDVEDLMRCAADAGYTYALLWLAWRREQAGDRASAEDHYLRAADAGQRSALFRLAEMWKKTGDQAGATNLRRYGLEPNGKPAAPWSWS